MALAYLGLGSNMGNRGANLAAARRALAGLPQTGLIKNAFVYETRPVGGPTGQGAFLNSASLVETTLSPYGLLEQIQKVEKDIGRKREAETVRWGPRVIDIDILLWDDLVVDDYGLTIPHPRLSKRAFALLPLADLDPDLLHPTLDLTVRELLERIDLANEGIRRLSV